MDINLLAPDDMVDLFGVTRSLVHYAGNDDVDNFAYIFTSNRITERDLEYMLYLASEYSVDVPLFLSNFYNDESIDRRLYNYARDFQNKDLMMAIENKYRQDS